MLRAIALGVLALLAVAGGMFAFISPPRLLSHYDRACGGGSDARLAAEGIPFGSQGQTLDIWAPERAEGPLPVVIFWYGGGWAKGDRASYAFAGRALAKAGFLVVIPDYRKVPDVHFPAFLDDGAEAVAWVEDSIARYQGDPARVAARASRIPWHPCRVPSPSCLVSRLPYSATVSRWGQRGTKAEILTQVSNRGMDRRMGLN